MVKDYLSPEELWANTLQRKTRHPQLPRTTCQCLPRAEAYKAPHLRVRRHTAPSILSGNSCKNTCRSRYHRSCLLRTCQLVTILLTLATRQGKQHWISNCIGMFQHSDGMYKEMDSQTRICFSRSKIFLAIRPLIHFRIHPRSLLVRIKSSEIKKKGGVPTNEVSSAPFLTFMSGTNGEAPAP